MPKPRPITRLLRLSEAELLLEMSAVISLREKVAQAELEVRDSFAEETIESDGPLKAECEWQARKGRRH
jgi:hypothetical protein